MHIGTNQFAAPSGARPQPRLLTLCYVIANGPGLAETFVANEIGALRSLGHTLVPIVLAAHDPAPADAAMQGGAMPPGELPLPEQAVRLEDVETLAALAAAAANPAGLAASVGFAQRQRGMSRRVLLRAAARLAHVARSHRCTHLHAHSAQGAASVTLCAARIAGLTASFTVHGADIVALTGGTVADLTLKLAATDLAVATGESIADEIRRLAPHASLRTIPIGVAPEQFRPLAGPSNGRLLAMAELLPTNGFDVLLAALAHAHPLLRPRVDIVGGGPLEAELRAFARDHDLQGSVRFLGARPVAWLAAEGPGYQGFVAPCAANPDGTSDSGALAVKQAMAMGLPVVALALPWVRELVDDRCARLVAVGDVAALAGAMTWLAALEFTARERLGAVGRARVQARFSVQQQAMRLAAAFADLRP